MGGRAARRQARRSGGEGTAVRPGLTGGVYRPLAEHDLALGGNRGYFSGAGEAVTTLDFGTRDFRPSTLVDIYDFARLVDRLEHIHAYSCFVVATDIEDGEIRAFHNVCRHWALSVVQGKVRRLPREDGFLSDAAPRSG